jgi:ribosomal protein L37AE/L43A
VLRDSGGRISVVRRLKTYLKEKNHEHPASLNASRKTLFSSSPEIWAVNVCSISAAATARTPLQPFKGVPV